MTVENREPAPIEPEVRPVEPGTPEPEPAPEPEDPAVLRAQLAEATRQKEQLLAEKANSEQRNRTIEELREENERLRGAVYQPPTPAEQPNLVVQRFQNGIAELQRRAADGDDAAAATLMMADMLNRMPQQFGERLALTEVPKDTRAEVERTIAEARQRGENISPATAQALLDAKKLRDQVGGLEKRIAEFGKGVEERRDDVVATHRAPAPRTPNTTRTMTYSEYGRQHADAEARGDWDAKAKLLADKKGGRITLKPD